MDPQNASFPAPVTRRVGGFSFQDLVMLDYPYFVDVRGEGLNQQSPITAGLPQVTLSWASPIELAVQTQQHRQVTELLRSSPGSWLSDSSDIMPKLDEQGLSGFNPEGELGSRILAVLVEGRFDSYFAGQTSPLLEQPTEPESTDADAEDADAEPDVAATLGVVSSVIERSADSARLFVFASNGFLADQTMRMVGSAQGTVYANSVQMMANVVDWALEDQSLLEIRSRGNFNRTLPPLSGPEQAFWEYLNYGFVFFGIGIVFFIYRRRMANARRLYTGWLGGGVS
jgi:ABC-2 type transport system permease protein